MDYCEQVKETKKMSVNRKCTTREELLAAYAGTEMGKVIEDFAAFTVQVDTLRDYVMLNLQAVIKITKKHDKHSDTSLQGDLVQQVHSRNFFRSQLFGKLIMDIEVLATQIIARLTGDLESDLSPNTMPLGSGIAQNFQCPACLEQLCNPIMLPCGHRFCMKCVSPASYFKKGYRCPVCQQEHTLDVETVKYGSLLNNSPLTPHTSVSTMFQQGGSNSSTPANLRDLSDPHTRKATPHVKAMKLKKKPQAAYVGGRGNAEPCKPYLTRRCDELQTHGEHLNYAEMERQMSERLMARARALEEDARYRRNSKGSPIADLSQVR